MQVGDWRLRSIAIDMGARVEIDFHFSGAKYLEGQLVPHAVQFFDGASDERNFAGGKPGQLGEQAGGPAFKVSRRACGTLGRISDFPGHYFRVCEVLTRERAWAAAAGDAGSAIWRRSGSLRTKFFAGTDFSASHAPVRIGMDKLTA